MMGQKKYGLPEFARAVTGKFRHRRQQPRGYAAATLRLAGTTALLMNSGEVDLESDDHQAFLGLSRKRGKTQDDERRLREMEWALALYYDEELGPYVPTKNLHEMLRQAATQWRKGAEVMRSLMFMDTRVPLLYDGPRDQKGLWDAEYRYTARVSNAGPSSGRPVRCRPRFEGWALEAMVVWNPEYLDYSPDLLRIVERAQAYGLGDYRPIFGSFVAELTEPTLHKDAASVNGAKKRSEREEAASAARRGALTARP